jgi:lysophospholipase L1-like esterase
VSRIGDWAFRGLIGALLFFGSAEIAVRLLQPAPRVQVITAAGTATMEQPLTDLLGVPVWRERGSAARARCEAAHTVLILGTSISFGVELPANAVFSAALQAELDRRAPGQWCVRNEAQPGFTLDNIMGLARDRVPALRPDVVLLELGNLGSYTLIDGAAYNLQDVATGPSGYPELVPLPPAWHRWLMGRSSLWRYVHLTLVRLQRDPAAEDARRTGAMAEAKALAEAGGGRLVLWVPTWIDGVVGQHDDRAPMSAEPIPAWAAAHGVPTLELAQAWAGRDTSALALDPVHFNAAGQAEVAKTLVPWLDAVGVLPPQIPAL